MRNFIFDVWIWSKDKHSRPIRIECKEFPSDRECWEYMAKDEEVAPYMKSSTMEISFNNLREYCK